MTDRTASDPALSCVERGTSSRGQCDLCGLPLPRYPIRSGTGDGERLFCCVGCRHVHQLLAESGLDEASFKESDLYQTSVRLGLIGDPGNSEELDTPHAIDLEGTSILSLQIDGMWCTSCSWLIEKVVASEPGVVQARVMFASDTARVRYRPEETSREKIEHAIEKLGYTPVDPDAGERDRSREKMTLVLKMGLALFLLMNVMFFSYVLYVGYFQDLSARMAGLIPALLLILTTPSVFWCGSSIHRRAVQSVLARAPTMELLISLSVLSAYFYSVYGWIHGSDHLYFDTASGLVALFLVGKLAEVSARQRASRSIRQLYRLAPRRVRLKTDVGDRQVSVETLQVGDRFYVRSGEKVATDGVVVNGSTTVDESLITGESTPVAKRIGDVVIGSTMSISGAVEVEAVRVGEETTLAGMIQLVERALEERSPIERTVDRVSRVFIPLVLLIAVVTGTVLLLRGIEFEPALLRAITVLVIACPCALGMATPLAVAAAIGQAAAEGILIRDGSVLEISRRVGSVLFDKTGTLTEGKFEVVSLQGEGNDYEAYSLVGSLERHSSHPIATAILKKCSAVGCKLEDAQEVRVFDGEGLSGTVIRGSPPSVTQVTVGKESFVRGQGHSLPTGLIRQATHEAEQGRTVVFFGIHGRDRDATAQESLLSYTGFLALGDILRVHAKETAQALRARGLSVHVISGDGEKTTKALASLAGIKNYTAAATPQDKINRIAELQRNGTVVAMVGDGVNDAPGLAQADIGIAMGGGTEIALESSSINLMRDDLRLVLEAFDLSRRTVVTIRQNLAWALIYNCVGISLAVAGALSPLFAAAAMLVSSLSVVGNSLRLKDREGRLAARVLEIILPWRGS